MKGTIIIRQLITWWRERFASQGWMVFIDPVQETKGADQRWNFFAEGDDVRTRLVGEHRAKVGFRGPVLRARDEGEADDFSDDPTLLVTGGQSDSLQPNVEIHGGASTVAPGMVYIRSGMDPDADEDFPTGAGIFCHPGQGDAYSADGNLHLFAGSDEAHWPRSAAGHIFAAAPIVIHPYTFDELADVTPYSGMQAFIKDSPTLTPSDVISAGGGSNFALAVYVDQWYCVWGIAI